MAIDFPPNSGHPLPPTIGELYPNPAIAGQPQYSWDGTKWTQATIPSSTIHVLKSGDTMTGLLTLSGDPTATNHAANKNYAETSLRQINAQTGTTYTLAISDTGKLVYLNNAAAITLTVAPNSSVAIPLNAQIDIVQGAAGQVTVTPGAGVTINSADGYKKTAKAYAAATLVKIAPDGWLLTGNLVA